MRLTWRFAGQIVCTEMWCYSLTGEAATVATHVVANLSSTAGIMLVSYFQFSEFFLCFVGVSFSASCVSSITYIQLWLKPIESIGHQYADCLADNTSLILFCQLVRPSVAWPLRLASNISTPWTGIRSDVGSRTWRGPLDKSAELSDVS